MVKKEEIMFATRIVILFAKRASLWLEITRFKRKFRCHGENEQKDSLSQTGEVRVNKIKCLECVHNYMMLAVVSHSHGCILSSSPLPRLISVLRCVLRSVLQWICWHRQWDLLWVRVPAMLRYMQVWCGKNIRYFIISLACLQYALFGRHRPGSKLSAFLCTFRPGQRASSSHETLAPWTYTFSKRGFPCLFQTVILLVTTSRHDTVVLLLALSISVLTIRRSFYKKEAVANYNL